jgi:hypothetical protein
VGLAVRLRAVHDLGRHADGSGKVRMLFQLLGQPLLFLRIFVHVHDLIADICRQKDRQRQSFFPIK